MEELTTEQKIIEAADKLFTQKGYAATKTREIAEEAGTNLALLNYYFGSKEKLFKTIVVEKFRLLQNAIRPLLSDENISLEEKVKLIIQNYTTLLLENGDLPIFILNELSVNKNLFIGIIQHTLDITKPVINTQLKEKGINLSLPDFIINILALTIFPFIAKPILLSSGLVKEDEFTELVLHRKDMIPNWITKIMD